MTNKRKVVLIFLTSLVLLLSSALAITYPHPCDDSNIYPTYNINNSFSDRDVSAIDHVVLNEMFPVTSEINNNEWEITGINFESKSTDETWTYIENDESIELTFDAMQWSNNEVIISGTNPSIGEINSDSSLTYPNALGNGINIKIIQDNFQWQKIVEIESLESLGSIPDNAEFLEISFLNRGDFTIPEGEITNPIPIGENSFIQPVRAWDDSNDYIFGVVGTVAGNIITKRIPVEYLRTASYPVQTDLTVTYGSQNGFNSGFFDYTFDISVARLDDTHFVVAYSDTSSRYGAARVGVVSGTTITSYGAESRFIESGNTPIIYHLSVVALDSTHFVVVYDDFITGTSYNVTSKVGVVSGTTITSYGAENVFQPSSTVLASLSATALDSTHFVVAYQDTLNSDYGTAKVGVVSGSTITSYGSGNVFNSASTDYISLATLDSAHFVVGYTDDGGDDYGAARVGVVSGTTISSYGAENIFNSAVTSEISVAALDDTHFVASYDDGGNSNYGTAIIGVVLGTTITSYGSENVFNSGDVGELSVTAVNSTHFIVGYEDVANSDYGTAIVGTVSGTTITSYGAENVFQSGRAEVVSLASLNSTHFVVAYQDPSVYAYGYARIGLTANPPPTYLPPTPVSLANTTGKFWVNHTWSAGSGNVTDSFKKSVNGTWYNNTATFYNDTYIAHSWQNITVYAYNSSGTGTLSTNSISQNTQIPNNPVTILNISASYSLNENETFILDANYTDLDNDTAVFSDNSSNWTINSATGEVSWLTTSGDVGTHYYRITAIDGYGSTDYQDFTVTVNDTLEILSTDPTGDFSIYISDAQELSAILNINATATWYVDSIESQTEYNTTTPDYYFTSSTSGTYNVTVICRDSSTNTSQVNFTWLINVSGAAPTPTPVRANRPVGQATSPVEEIIVEEEPGILTSLWDKAEVLDQEDDVDNIIIGLGTLFILLFLFVMKKGGGSDTTPGRREPIKM